MLSGITYSIHLIIACRRLDSRHTHAHAKSWVKIITAKAVLQSVSFFLAVVVVAEMCFASSIHRWDVEIVYDAKFNFFSPFLLKIYRICVSFFISLQINARMIKRANEKKTIQNWTNKMCAKNFCACELKRRKKQKKKKKETSSHGMFWTALSCNRIHRYTGVI